MTTLTTIEEVAAIIAHTAPTADRVIVAIAGSPGSGKSTIGEQVVAALGPSAALLAMDGFHLPQATLRQLGRRERMGAPDTFDVDGFVNILEQLRAPFSGAIVVAPGFDRAIEESVPGAIQIPPETRVLVIEGNYLLLADDSGWGRVRALVDVSFFVRVDRDIRLRRLIARHVRFGKTADDAAAWATGPDEANARLIEATAANADHQIDVG